MIKFDGQPVSASIGLLTDGVTLSGNGTQESPIGFIGGHPRRYTKLLYSGDSAVPNSYISGTLSAAPSAFDEMIIGLNFPPTNTSATQRQDYYTPINANGDYHFCNFFLYDNDLYWQEGTIMIPSSGGTFRVTDNYRVKKNITNTAAFTGNTSSTYVQRNVEAIWGVKFL